MANWCVTHIAITHEDREAIEKLYDNILSWTSHNAEENDFGQYWLGNIVLNADVGTVYTQFGERKDTDLACRGYITAMWLEKNRLIIYEDSAWEPAVQLWLRVLDKYLPGAILTYDAEEPGTILYWTNNPDLVGRYRVNPYDYEDIESEIAATDKDIVDILRWLLDTDEDDIDKLMRMYKESVLDISINQWVYKDSVELK